MTGGTLILGNRHAMGCEFSVYSMRDTIRSNRGAPLSSEEYSGLANTMSAKLEDMASMIILGN